MRKYIKFTVGVLFFFIAQSIIAQTRIDLWKQGAVPNAIGIPAPDSIANERIYRVSMPRMQAFYTSVQENKGGAVLIIPGGGYSRLAYEVSGYQLAKMFNTIGMHAFVLEHRLPRSSNSKMTELAPLEDAQRALRIIRSLADSLGIDTAKVGVLGSSAGGHLAASVSTWEKDVSSTGEKIDTYSFKPNFQILISPVIDMYEYAHVGSREQLLGKAPKEQDKRRFSLQYQVTPSTPRAFLVHAFNDKSVPVGNSLLYYSALVDKGVSSTIHVFPQGGHSISLRDNPGSCHLWLALLEAWLKEIEVLPYNPVN